MLTLAEEVGLGGYYLASRVRQAFASLPEGDVAGLMAQMREEGAQRHMVYLRDGKQEVIGVFPLPLTALPDQMSYLHFVSQTVQNALKRLPEIYFQDFAVREVLRLPPEEEEWLLQCWGPSQRDNNPVFPHTVLLPQPIANNGDHRNGGAVGGWLTIFKGAPNVDLAKQLARRGGRRDFHTVLPRIQQECRRRMGMAGAGVDPRHDLAAGIGDGDDDRGTRS